ncbi:MAG: UbiH/UbiF/VisC/COQ6 family ubiquinone biosynthesis hydroxylase [Kangiellaceae bacterium]|nr:UbiH/UbiF/VisC/COQ6 family ubiquinone biosynthesis hydroxylase [Kangiellaceae bacterium]
MKTHSPKPKFSHDIVIVGGGMVGLALAAKLTNYGFGNSQLKIAVVDPKPVQMDWDVSEYDLRVSAITRASENLFREVGAWDYIGETEKSAYQRMYVWDGESSRGKIEFDAGLVAQTDLGHIVENRVLRRALFQAIEKQNNIDWLCPQQCSSVEYHEDFAQLTLQSGQQLTCQLLVAADGAFSWLREHSGVDLEATAYGHKAIVCTVETELPHQATAYQRFDHHGPLAFLPLPEKHTSSIVWSVDEAKAKNLLDLSQQDFTKQLEQTFESHLGRIKNISKRVAFPLFERTSDRMINHRLALVGDAAHTIHPLAGQGVNLGFSDVLELANLIEKNQQKQKDIGIKSSLRPYERARKGDIFVMQKAMLGFKKLFEQEKPFVQMLRSYGMNIADRHPLLKQQLIKKAMGL